MRVPELEIAGAAQFGVEPAGLECLRVGIKRVMAAARHKGLRDSISGQHTRLDCGVAALDAGRIEHARVAANERTPRKHQPGHGLQATIIQRPGAVADALAALDVRADGRMQLPALHFFKRTYPRVGVVQAEHISQADHIVFEVVKKSSAKTVVRRRPARSVQHQARLRLFGGYFP